MSLFGTKEKEEIIKLSDEVRNLNEIIKQFQIRQDELNEIIRTKEENISKISKSPHDKQFEKITIEFDKVRKEYFDLKNTHQTTLERLKNLEKENKEMKNSTTLSKEKRYKILIKDFYSARKHDDFKKICDSLGITYVFELDNFDFQKLIDQGASKTKITNAKNEYIEYRDGDITTEIEKYISYGHKVSKIYFRYRTFVSYMIDEGINYMYQLDDFDFSRLEAENFTKIQIEKFKKKLEEYNRLRKI